MCARAAGPERLTKIGLPRHRSTCCHGRCRLSHSARTPSRSSSADRVHEGSTSMCRKWVGRNNKGIAPARSWRFHQKRVNCRHPDGIAPMQRTRQARPAGPDEIRDLQSHDVRQVAYVRTQASTLIELCLRRHARSRAHREAGVALLAGPGPGARGRIADAVERRRQLHQQLE